MSLLPAPPHWRDPWHGRIDAADGEAGERWHQVVQPWSSIESIEGSAAPTPGAIALLGLASDEGVRRNQGRIGAAAGPHALRRMLANLPADWADPAAPSAGFTRIRVVDAGDIACAGGDLEAAQQGYADRAQTLLDQGLRPIGLGGGHEIGWASSQAWLARQVPGQRLGLLNFDAHFDLRAGPEATSGTPFRQALEHAQQRGLDLQYRCIGISPFANTAALFAQAQAHGVAWQPDSACSVAQLPALERWLTAWLDQIDALYLTICLDVLPASVAPGVSAPSSLGVAQEVVEALVAQAARSGKLQIADVAELNPQHDIDHRTARVAARLVATLAHHWLRAPLCPVATTTSKA